MPSNNHLYKSFFENNANLFVSQIKNDKEEAEAEDFRFSQKMTGTKKLYRNSEHQNTLTIKSVQKKVNLEKSQMILSEIYDANEYLRSKKKNYIKKNFLTRINKKKPTMNDSFKEAKERMQYDKKLTEYLHKKPNIHMILKKYTTDVNPLITEIHNVENFNDKNMIETISRRENSAFLKRKYENFEEKIRIAKQKKDNTYFLIKRNDISKIPVNNKK